MTPHQTYIKRCIELAQNGLGATYPNPLVGSVIVHNNTIIGEGWHQKSGEPHAEVIAITSVKDKNLLKESTIYVSLEPCSHFGKTPPCADFIIKHKIPKVVIGTVDPFAKVCGNGILKLKEAGIQVEAGFLEEECEQLNKRFFTFHQEKRPYIILKWAQTQNGFIAPTHKNYNRPVWISNEFSRQLVHKWRSEEQAILVGTNTVLQDNPTLDIRDWTGHNPIRIVLDRELKISEDSSVYNASSKTIFITEKHKVSNKENIFFETANFQKDITKQILTILYKHEIQSVIIEGGAAVLESFIKDHLWDEVRIFTSNLIIENGIKAPQFVFEKSSHLHILSDTLSLFYNYPNNNGNK